MPSPSSVFSELVATTFRQHQKGIKDNVTKNNALLRRLRSGNFIKKSTGGLSIVATLEYAENATYQRYSGYDVLNIGASDTLTAAEFQWRQIAVNVAANGMELRINSGDEQIISLAKARIKNATNTFANNFSSDIYSAGILTNQINGLQALVSDTGTGTIGGIDSSTWSFWANKVQSAAAPLQGGGAITPSATTIESLMQPLWLNLIRGNDKPDLIVCDFNYFTFFENSQLSIKRYMDSSKADAGFAELSYKGCPVIFDGNSGIPSNRMYFLNTNYLGMTEHRDAAMTVMDEMRPINQDATVIPILWMGNMTVSNRSLQGVLKP